MATLAVATLPWQVLQASPAGADHGLAHPDFQVTMSVSPSPATVGQAVTVTGRAVNVGDDYFHPNSFLLWYFDGFTQGTTGTVQVPVGCDTLQSNLGLALACPYDSSQQGVVTTRSVRVTYKQAGTVPILFGAQPGELGVDQNDADNEAETTLVVQPAAANPLTGVVAQLLAFLQQLLGGLAPPA